MGKSRTVDGALSSPWFAAFGRVAGLAGLGLCLSLSAGACVDGVVTTTASTTEDETSTTEDDGSTGTTAGGSTGTTIQPTTTQEPTTEEPTTEAPAVCGDGEVGGDEDCDAGGEDSDECDADCTFQECGDSYVNEAAGESCDDGGPTASCDDDCSPVECGDGNANDAAGEQCDVGTEDTAECNAASCTTASCGDSYINEAAGESCDDGGESETCDADCSAAECGDDYTNALAGEECDTQEPLMNGACNLETCTVECTGFWANCNLDPADGCEANLTDDVNNCLECGMACEDGEMCQVGSCVPAP